MGIWLEVTVISWDKVENENLIDEEREFFDFPKATIYLENPCWLDEF